MRRGILAARDELRALRDRIARKPFDAIYQALQKRCALILESAPISEQQWQVLWNQGSWASAVHAAQAAQGRILDLLVAHHIDPNLAYRDRAVEELRSLVGWSTWVDPCHAPLAADLCTAEAATAAVIALDWLWEDLSDRDRGRVLDAIRGKAIGPYLTSVREGAWWYTCYHNWNAVVNGGCGLAALALSDGDDAAGEAYRLAREGLKPFLNALGREGGWDEGIGYWGHGMRYALLLGEAASRLDDDQRILHSRGMDATGLFPIYFTPNGQPASFGDMAAVPLHGTFYLLVKHFGRREVAWWLDTYSFHRDVTTTGWSAAGLALLFRPPKARTTSDPRLSPLKVFGQIGWAAIADHWPRPTLYVAAKTGDLSANHSQRDMNSIQLQADGEMLLIDLGHPPYSREYLSNGRADFYEVQAQAHNTITVAGEDHCIDAQGSIIEVRKAKTYRWIACDSGGACGENTSFVRHLVMLVSPADGAGEAVVVLDELNQGVPEKVEMFWHAGGRIELDEATRSGRIIGRRSELDFAVASTVKGRLWVECRREEANHPDRLLHFSAGVVGRALFASVFSRRRFGGGLAVSEDGEGAVVRLGDVRLEFKGGAHLRFKGVAAK
jgi:hypothetical protein